MTKHYTLFLNLFNVLKSNFILIFLLTIIINLLGICVALYSMQIFDKVINSGSVETLFYLTLITVIVIFFISFFYELRLLVIFKLSDKIFKYLFSCIDKKHQIKTKLDHYQILDKIKNYFSQNSFIIFFEIIVSLSYLVVIYLIHFVAFFYALFCVFLILLIDFFLFKKNLLYLKNSQTNLNNNLNTLITNKNLNNKNELLIEKIYKDYQKNFIITNKLKENYLFYNIKNNYINKNIRILIQVLSVMIGAYLAILNQISIGSIIAMSILLSKFLEPFGNFSYNYEQLKEVILNLKNFFSRKDLVLDKVIYSQDLDNIHFCNVCYFDEFYNYKIIIDNISFKKGDIVGIIARNDCEKMAIYNFLSGKYCSSSSVIKINNLNLDNLYIKNFIDLIDDEPIILEGDIFFNISLEFDKSSQQKIFELIIESGFVEELNFLIKNPQTDLTKIDLNLKNIIVILRILYNLPKILFVKNDNLLIYNKALYNIFFNRIKNKFITTFFINPNPYIIKNCNYLIIFKKGRAEIVPLNQFLSQYEKKTTLLS